MVRAEAKLITYGPNSKADTEDGKTLSDTRYKVMGGLRYRLAGPLALVAEAEWLQRDTNFRDYVPGVYPVAALRPYDIAWDYSNTMVTAGLEWKP
jgi:opacity protein-like surface antigen